MVNTYAYGFPRIGKNREFKKIVEMFWKDKIDEHGLITGLDAIGGQREQSYMENVDAYPSDETTLYDKMLDTACMVGLYSPNNAKEYYDLCRGKNCLEMTKWFNTNYHYLVPDFSSWDRPQFRVQGELTECNNPYLIGPYTFLKLSKGIPEDKFEEFALYLAETYREIINRYDTVHIDEPAFVMDDVDVSLVTEMYQIMNLYKKTSINVFTYYDDVDWLRELFMLDVNGIGLDFVNGKNNLRDVLSMGKTLTNDKTLFAGFVDGINVWKTDIRHAVVNLSYLEKITDVVVTNAGPLYHLPVQLDGEKGLPEYLYGSLSFATEKLYELRDIQDKNTEGYTKHSGQWNNMVEQRVGDLRDEDFVKSLDVVERRKLQDEILNLPELPTTTIGSFPQTKEVRVNRLHRKKGKISLEEYNGKVDNFVKDAIEFQEDLGFDVLVHGESERSDMVEHFCQRLDGMQSTDNGWIISYGTRVYRPSIIHGDVRRPEPMTIREIEYAQTLTDKPVKGMLTGAVTIMAWDFVRKDIPIEKVAYQIGLALQD